MGTAVITDRRRGDRARHRLLRLEVGAPSAVRGDDLEAEARLLQFVDADPWRAERVGLLEPIIASAGRRHLPDARAWSPSCGSRTPSSSSPRSCATLPGRIPLILVLDDGHWMDSASWAMAERVAREIPSLLVVIGTRPFSRRAATRHRRST